MVWNHLHVINTPTNAALSWFCLRAAIHGAAQILVILVSKPISFAVDNVRFVQVVAPASGEALLQISQLVVTEEGTNINRARGKSCTASSYFPGSAPCSVALDGTLSTRNYPNGFHSANFNNDWFRVDLGANYRVSSVTYYNRADCCPHRSQNARVILLSSTGATLAYRVLTSAAVQNLTFPSQESFFYENSLGGGWILVRRVRPGATWHPAWDNLQGYESYGTYNHSTSDQTFSINFVHMITPSTEFLFMTGNLCLIFSLFYVHTCFSS
jgi:hypothetical protein